MNRDLPVGERTEDMLRKSILGKGNYMDRGWRGSENRGPVLEVDVN